MFVKNNEIMKRALFSIFLLVIVLDLQAQTTYPSGATGCVARWTFDTTAGTTMLTTLLDKSNNNNNGMPYNINSVNGFRNKANSAGGFDGSTSWAEVTHNANLNLTEFTIISLIRFDTFNTDLCQGNQIISKGYPYFTGGNYGQSLGDNPFDGSCNTVSPNNVQLVSQSGFTAPSFQAGNYLELNKWYFLVSVQKIDTLIQYAAVMDTSNKLLAITPINAIPGSYNIGANSQNISIGRHLNPQYPYWVKGKIDEIVLFNRALTTNEIYGVYSYLWGWPAGISGVGKSADFDVNSVNGKLFIGTNQSNYSVEVYNLAGQKITTMHNCYNSQTIDSNSAGLLIVKITNNNNNQFVSKVTINE